MDQRAGWRPCWWPAGEPIKWPHVISTPCVVLCRWTTTCPRRLWCTGTVCQKVSWGWWSSMRSHSWSNALTLSPATNPSWSSSWSKSASAPPCTPVVPARLARLRLELFWITPSLTETGQVYSWCEAAGGCVTILTPSCCSFFSSQGGLLSDGTSHQPGLWTPYALHLFVQHSKPLSRPFAKVSITTEQI